MKIIYIITIGILLFESKSYAQNNDTTRQVVFVVMDKYRDLIKFNKGHKPHASSCWLSENLLLAPETESKYSGKHNCICDSVLGQVSKKTLHCIFILPSGLIVGESDVWGEGYIGVFQFYHRNGKLKIIGEISFSGYKTGKWIKYNKRGKIIKQRIYKVEDKMYPGSDKF